MSANRDDREFMIGIGIFILFLLISIFFYDNQELFQNIVSNGTISGTSPLEKGFVQTEKPTIVITSPGFDSLGVATVNDTFSVALHTIVPGNHDSAKHYRRESVYNITGNLEPVSHDMRMPDPVEKSGELAPPAERFKAILSISPDKSMECKLVELNNSKWLMIYPNNNDWQETYVIYPLTVADKKKLNYLIRRDFSGVTYPYYSAGRISLHGKMEDVRLIRMKGSQPDAGYPYYLNLFDKPQFLIFGDYGSRNKWYIYENGMVRLFNAAPDVKLDSLRF